MTIMETTWSAPTRCQYCGTAMEKGEPGVIAKHFGAYDDVYIDHICLACAAIRNNE